MATRLNPYISFNGNAREALEFYKEVFGGTLALSTFGEFGNPGEGGDKIMHGMLETDQGYTLMGADTPPGMPYNPGDNITVSLSGDDGDVLRGYWSNCREQVRSAFRSRSRCGATNSAPVQTNSVFPGW